MSLNSGYVGANVIAKKNILVDEFLPLCAIHYTTEAKCKFKKRISFVSNPSIFLWPDNDYHIFLYRITPT